MSSSPPASPRQTRAAAPEAEGPGWLGQAELGGQGERPVGELDGFGDGPPGTHSCPGLARPAPGRVRGRGRAARPGPGRRWTGSGHAGRRAAGGRARSRSSPWASEMTSPRARNSSMACSIGALRPRRTVPAGAALRRGGPAVPRAAGWLSLVSWRALGVVAFGGWPRRCPWPGPRRASGSGPRWRPAPRRGDRWRRGRGRGRWCSGRRGSRRGRRPVPRRWPRSRPRRAGGAGRGSARGICA